MALINQVIEEAKKQKATTTTKVNKAAPTGGLANQVKTSVPKTVAPVAPTPNVSPKTNGVTNVLNKVKEKQDAKASAATNILNKVKENKPVTNTGLTPNKGKSEVLKNLRPQEETSEELKSVVEQLNKNYKINPYSALYDPNTQALEQRRQELMNEEKLQSEKKDLVTIPEYQKAYEEALAKGDKEEANRINEIIDALDDTSFERLKKSAVAGGKNAFATVANLPNIVADISYEKDALGYEEQYKRALAEGNTEEAEYYKERAEESRKRAEGFDALGDSNAVSQWANEIRNESQKIMELERIGASSTDMVMMDVADTVANMTPSIVANMVVPGSGLVVLGGQVFSSTYAQRIEEGYDMQTATNNALATASIEVASEMLGEVFGKAAKHIPGFSKLMDTAPAKVYVAISSKLSQYTPSYIQDMHSEGLEEVFSDIVQPWADYFTLPDKKEIEYKPGDIFRDYIMSYPTTLALGAFGIPGRVIKTSKQMYTAQHDLNVLNESEMRFGSLGGEFSSKMELAKRNLLSAIEDFKNNSVVASAIKVQSDMVEDITLDDYLNLYDEALKPTTDKVGSAINQEINKSLQNALTLEAEYLAKNKINASPGVWAGVSEDIKNEVRELADKGMKLDFNEYITETDSKVRQAMVEIAEKNIKGRNGEDFDAREYMELTPEQKANAEQIGKIAKTIKGNVRAAKLRKGINGFRDSDARATVVSVDQTTTIDANKLMGMENFDAPVRENFKTEAEFLKAKNEFLENLSKEAGAQESAMTTVGHEVGHSVEETSISEETENALKYLNGEYTDPYRDLKKAVTEYLGGEENFKKMADRIGAIYKLQNVDKFNAENEAVAFTVQTFAEDPEFFARVAKYNDSVAYSMYRDFMATLTGNKKMLVENAYARGVAQANRKSAELGVQYSAGLRQDGSRKDLRAQHNLSADNLSKALDLGGLIMPSTAITKDSIPHEGYGDITLVFDKDTIDPSNSDNEVFTRDAWTPTFPAISYKLSNKAYKIRDSIEQLVSKSVDPRNIQSVMVDDENFNNLMAKNKGSIADSYKDSLAMKIAYLNDTGDTYQMPTKGGNLGSLSRKPDNFIRKSAEALKDYDLSKIDYYSDIDSEIEEKLSKLYHDYLYDDYYNRIKEKPNHPLYKNGSIEERAERLASTSMEHTWTPFSARDVVNDVKRYLERGEYEVPDIDKAREELSYLENDENFHKWIEKTMDGIIEKKGIRNQKDTFTKSGNRRSFEALHDPYTPEGILKNMKEQEHTDSFFGFSNFNYFLGVSSGKFNDVNDIISREGSLQPNDNNEQYDALANRYSDFVQKLRGSRQGSGDVFWDFVSFDGVMDEAIKKIKRNADTNSIIKTFKDYRFNVSADQVNELRSLIKDGKELTTDYFEAKPRRIVRPNEWKQAYVPNTTDPNLIQRLKDMGVEVIEYDKNIPGDRQAKMNGEGGTERYQFSKGISPQMETEYDTAVENNDMETAQRLVDEVAIGKGLKKVYHGSPETFNEFRPDPWSKEVNGDTNIQGFFSEDPEYSESYGYVKPYYIDPGKVLEVDDYVRSPEEWKKWLESKGIKNVKFDSGFPEDTLLGARYPNEPTRYALYEIIGHAGYYWHGDGNLTQKIREAGYDTIHWDYGEQAYMPLRKNVIKSADPVTYDDNNNVIPLSERFSDKTNDTRYSVGISNNLKDYKTVGDMPNQVQERLFSDYHIDYPSVSRQSFKDIKTNKLDEYYKKTASRLLFDYNRDEGRSWYEPRNDSDDSYEVKPLQYSVGLKMNDTVGDLPAEAREKLWSDFHIDYRNVPYEKFKSMRIKQLDSYYQGVAKDLYNEYREDDSYEVRPWQYSMGLKPEQTVRLKSGKIPAKVSKIIQKAYNAFDEGYSNDMEQFGVSYENVADEFLEAANEVATNGEISKETMDRLRDILYYGVENVYEPGERGKDVYEQIKDILKTHPLSNSAIGQKYVDYGADGKKHMTRLHKGMTQGTLNDMRRNGIRFKNGGYDLGELESVFKEAGLGQYFDERTFSDLEDFNKTLSDLQLTLQNQTHKSYDMAEFAEETEESFNQFFDETMKQFVRDVSGDYKLNRRKFGQTYHPRLLTFKDGAENHIEDIKKNGFFGDDHKLFKNGTELGLKKGDMVMLIPPGYSIWGGYEGGFKPKDFEIVTADRNVESQDVTDYLYSLYSKEYDKAHGETTTSDVMSDQVAEVIDSLDVSDEEFNKFVKRDPISPRALENITKHKKELVDTAPEWIPNYDIIREKHPEFTDLEMNDALFEILSEGTISESTAWRIKEDMLRRNSVQTNNEADQSIKELVDDSLDYFAADAAYKMNKKAMNSVANKANTIIRSFTGQNVTESALDSYEQMEGLEKTLKQVEKRRGEVSAKNETMVKELLAAGADYGSSWMTLEQNLDKIAGTNSNLRQTLRDYFELPKYESQIKYVQFLQKYGDTLQGLVKDGIRAGTKESAAVQYMLEGHTEDGAKYGQKELMEQFPKTWEKLDKAAKTLRNMYDEMYNLIETNRENTYGDIDAKYDLQLAKARDKANNARRTADQIKQKLSEKADARLEAMFNRADAQASKLERQYEQMLEDKATRDGTRRQKLQYRKNYAHHLTDQGGFFKQMKNALSDGSSVPTKLSGISNRAKPLSGFASFFQRQNAQTGYVADAIGGMAEYIKDASKIYAYDPYIEYLRFAASDIRAEASGNEMSRFVSWVDNYANGIAGKTQMLDRGIRETFGEKPLKVIKTLNNQARKNAIVGNLSTALVQFANLPNAIGVLSQYGGAESALDIARGLSAYASTLGRDGAESVSPFMSARYYDINTMKGNVAQRSLNGIAKTLLEFGDHEAAKMIWNCSYQQALRLNVDDPVMYADDLTRRSVAGRSVSELPLAMESQVLKLLMPFQVETNNTFHLMTGLMRDKKLGSLLAMLIGGWLMNGLYEAVIGRRPITDPIDAIIDGAQSDNPADIATRLGGELLSAIPGSSYAVSLFGLNDNQRKKLFGENDPSRYGTGNIGLSTIGSATMDLYNAFDKKDPRYAMNAVSDLASTYLAPGGGRQIQRTVEGLQSEGMIPQYVNGEWVSEPRYYTPSGKVGFVNDPNDIFDVITAGTFGRWATKAGKEYLENGGKYLSDQATRQLEALGGDQAAYDAVIAMRDMQGIPGVDNSKALQKRKYLEDQGLWDTFAENMDGEWGDYGLNKTVGNASEDEFNKLYSEVFGNEDMRLDVASAAGMKETLDTNKEEKETKTDANLDFLAGTPYEKAAIQNLDMDEDVLQTVTDLGYDYKTIKQIDDYIDNTDSLRKEDGSAIRNTKALQMRQYYEEMGVYDDIFEYISENGLDPQDYGLNKTVMGYSDSKFESQYSKYYGGSSSSSSSKSSGSSSSGSSRKSSKRKSSKKKGFSSEEEMKAFFDQLVANIGLSSSKSSTSAINNILKKSKNLRNTKFSKRSS